MRIYLIIRIFKATLAQAVNIEAYLTLISFKLNKRIDQIAPHLYSKLLYYMLIQSWSTHLKQIFTPLEILKKCYVRLFSNNIYKVENKLAYVVVFW